MRLRVLLLTAAAATLVALQQPGLVLIVTPAHADEIYETGNRVSWSLRLLDPSSGQGYTYSLRENNAVSLQSGPVQFVDGRATISAVLDHPAMLYLEVQPPSGKPLAYGAAVSPSRLRPVQAKPADFDSFWAGKLRELRSIPENAVVTPGDSGKPGVDYATIRMDHVNGTHVYGQIAKPSRPGKFPAMLVLQWASPPYRLWSPWVVDPASQGWLALNIEPHDVLPTEPQSYYDALPQTLKNYGSIGMEDKNASYFVEMYLRDVRAVDYLTKRPDWDHKTLLVIGTSMGGQQSFAVAGLHPAVTHLIVNVPAGCDLVPPSFGRQEGYPFFPTNDAKAMETARYVDCVNFASKIKASSLVAMGFVDTVSPPAGVWTVFNQIKGPKEAAPMPESPHNNFATAEQQRPYTERSAAWLKSLVRGEPAPVRPWTKP